MRCKKRSLDAYLVEVFKQFVSIKKEDFEKSQKVFKSVFEQVTQKMGEQCNFFKKYSRQIMHAGSVADGIKVGRMDEFDMDIVIRLPINYNDIVIENEEPGFVKLKITDAFDHLDKQPNWENCHKVTREWRDEDKYFLQNKFRQWMHKNVQKALNLMEGKVVVNGDVYLLTYTESGPAYTLNIRNDEGTDKYALDVDLVPVIKFMLPRAPDGYRVVNGIAAKDWLVVPKPNKALTDNTLKNRCWRLSFQEQERELIKDCKSLKTTVRLVKKLRDALEMKAIASYYIKSLFLKKIDDMQDKTYWQKKVSLLFRTMVEELYQAISKKNIPFFWNSEHNLIGGLKPTLQKVYCDKLKNVIVAIDANDVEKVVGALLTTEELREFKKSEFYQKQRGELMAAQTDNSLFVQINMLNGPDDALCSKDEKEDKFEFKKSEFYQKQRGELIAAQTDNSLFVQINMLNGPDDALCSKDEKEDKFEFKKSEFYQKAATLPELPPFLVSCVSKSSVESSQSDNSLSDQVKMLNDELHTLRGKNQKDEKFEELEDKMNKLADRVSLLESRMAQLELAERKGTQLSVADIVAAEEFDPNRRLKAKRP